MIWTNQTSVFWLMMTVELGISLSMVDNYQDEFYEDYPESKSQIIHRYQVQNNEGRYKFGFSDTSGQYRVEESDGDGGVVGSYGYVDSNGYQVRTYYKAGVGGFQIINKEIYESLKQQLMNRSKPNPTRTPPRVTATNFYHYSSPTNSRRIPIILTV
ncbi:hypothetical protein CHUAL_008374 [Chamberlinius hualienensis]